MATPTTWNLPFGTGKDSGEEDAQSIFSAKIIVPNQLYTYNNEKKN
jgi:hypothetical protein